VDRQAADDESKKQTIAMDKYKPNDRLSSVPVTKYMTLRFLPRDLCVNIVILDYVDDPELRRGLERIPRLMVPGTSDP